MKKTFQILFVTLSILTITSCSTDNDDIVNEKLIQKIVEVNKDETSTTYSFTYNGKKIRSINSEKTNITFTYTGNLITKIIELNYTTQLQTTFDYLYTDDKLTKIICSDNYILNYTHNSDGTIFYQKTTTDVNNNIVLLNHGTLTLNAENVVDDKKTLDTTSSNIISKKEVSFTYDTKNNPLNNILGYNKLLDRYATISANNANYSIEIESTKYLDTDQIVSSANQYTRSYQYDHDDYPIEVISDYPVFENKNFNHLKSLYFY
jgi:hypothetical protein